MFGPLFRKQQNKIEEHDRKRASYQQTVNHAINGRIRSEIDLKTVIDLFAQQVPLARYEHHVEQHHDGLGKEVQFQGFLDPHRDQQKREVDN